MHRLLHCQRREGTGFCEAKAAFHCGIGADHGRSHRQFEPDGTAIMCLDSVTQLKGVGGLGPDCPAKLQRQRFLFGQVGVALQPAADRFPRDIVDQRQMRAGERTGATILDQISTDAGATTWRCLAIEGFAPAFRCTEIRQNSPFGLKRKDCKSPCQIAAAFAVAERAFRDSLKLVTLVDLSGQVLRDSKPEHLKDVMEWLGAEVVPLSKKLSWNMLSGIID